jgi:hypothetical protein
MDEQQVANEPAKKFVIVAAVILILLLVGGSYFAMKQSPSGEVRVVETYDRNWLAPEERHDLRNSYEDHMKSKEKTGEQSSGDDTEEFDLKYESENKDVNNDEELPLDDLEANSTED